MRGFGCIAAATPARELPEFNPGWYAALLDARKDWLRDFLNNLGDRGDLSDFEKNQELLKLSDSDLTLCGLVRKRLELKQ